MGVGGNRPSYADFLGGFRRSTGFSASPDSKETAMEKGIRNILTAAATTALALTGGTSRAADPQGPTVVVHLADLAGIGSAGLSRMKVHAGRVF